MTLEGGVLTKVSKDDKTGSERVVKSGTTSIKVDYKTVRDLRCLTGVAEPEVHFLTVPRVS